MTSAIQKKLIKAKFEPLTEDVYKLCQAAKNNSTGGVITDPAAFRFPFMLRWPNPWEKRHVDVSITRYFMYPHYWVKFHEEPNYFVGLNDYDDKKRLPFIWRRPWTGFIWDDNPVSVAIRRNEEWRDLCCGKEIQPFEANSAKEAEKYIKTTIARNFADPERYSIHIDDMSGETAYYTKDGD